MLRSRRTSTNNTMMLAYIAAPLFSDAERSYNEELRALLSKHVTCYLPQRDGIVLAHAVDDGADREHTASMVFSADIAALRSAHVVIAVLDGSEVDAGVAVEIGVAWAI